MNQQPVQVASYPGLLTPVFVAFSTASDKRWDKKAWVQGYCSGWSEFHREMVSGTK